MPEFPGRFRTPRLSLAPSSPAVGEMYYDTGTNTMFWWNGTSWVSASGSGTPVDYGYRPGGWGANIAMSAGAWKTLSPVSGTPTIDPVGAFTENADGSITVNSTGWYQINAQAGINTNAAWQLCLGGGADAEGFWGQANTGAGATGGILSVSTTVKLTAGTKIYVTAKCGSATTGTLYYFAITRTGSGAATASSNAVHAKLRMNGAKAFSASTVSMVAWDSATNYNGVVWTSGSPGIITLPETGWYMITARMYFSTTGKDLILTQYNNTGQRFAEASSDDSGGGYVSLAYMGQFAAGYQLGLYVFSTSSGNYGSNNEQGASLEIHRLDVTLPSAVASGSVPQLVASLPGSPVDGQEIYFLADATNGIVWHLRYRTASASAYKWEYLGGPPLTHDLNPSGETTNSLSYVDLATVGPQVTLPLAGDYIAEGGCSIATTSNIAYIGYAALKLGAAATADSEIMSLTADAASTATRGAHGGRMMRLNGRAAGDVLKLQYKTVASCTISVERRWLEVTPVRVG